MTGETWYLPSPDGEGTLVLNAHDRGLCSGGGCALHDPSMHWARDMPLRWKHDTQGGAMERLCPHGVWHDDPDDLDYRTTRGRSPLYRHPEGACECVCLCDTEPPF